MNAKSLELFKALTEATFWFYTHPKDTSYRLIYNKSRYTMDKVRILKMLRLYMPFVRRLDDQALVTYMYRNGGVVVAQMQSGQLSNLTSISDLIPDTLRTVSEADLVAQQKAIDEALAKEQEAQRVKEEERVKREAESKKKDAETDGQKNPKKVTSPAKPEPTPVVPVYNDEYADISENLGMRGGTGVFETPPVISTTATPNLKSQMGGDRRTLTQPKIGSTSVRDNSKVGVGPSRWERMMGGAMNASSGAPIVNSGRNLSSQAGIFVKRQGIDRVGKVFSGWLNRGGSQEGISGNSYEIEEDFDEYTVYSRAGEEDEKKKGWSMLGLGLGWWLAILFIFVLIFSALGGSEDETVENGDSGKPGEEVSGVGGNCPTTEAIKANRQSPESCRYFGLGVDLFNTNISNTAIETYVSKYSPVFIKAGKGDVAEFRERVNYIVQSSKTAGLNPVLFLGYWRTESLFGTVGSRDLGCVGDDFYEQVDCALGIRAFADPIKNPIANCARSKDAESIACKTLKGIRSKPFLDPQNPISYPIKTFDDFAEAHGSRAPGLDGGAVNNNCVSTYNSLVEEAISAGECKVSAGGDNCLAGWPTTGTITQGPKGTYSHLEIYNRNGDSRSAVDIAGPVGTPVVATFPGEISYICTGLCGGGGNSVYLKVDPSVAKNDSAVVRFLHLSVIDKAVTVGAKISPGSPIGLMGNTGGPAERPYGSHLHYDFQNLALAKPNIPTNIVPESCDEPNVSCNNPKITVCSAAAVTVEKPEGGDYWFLMNRIGKYEILYKGEPGVISKSKVVKVSRVNPGSPGKEPTPLPQKVGSQKYWLTTAGLITYRPENEDAYYKFGPYFIPLNVPTSYRDPVCANEAKAKGEVTEDCYGPKYEECGASGAEQCNWLTAGQFAIHGNNRLDEEGSAGCVRHMNDDISEIYNLLKAENKLVGTRYYVIDDQAAPSGLNDQILERDLR